MEAIILGFLSFENFRAVVLDGFDRLMWCGVANRNEIRSCESYRVSSLLYAELGSRVGGVYNDEEDDSDESNRF